MRLLVALMLFVPVAASADVVEDAVNRHILPGFAALTEKTGELDAAAQADCAPQSESLRAAYNEAFDAWIAVSHLRFGPTESDNRAFALAFWPDTKGATGRTLGQLIADEDPVVNDPEAFRDVSIAARGFYGMEQLLYGPFDAAGEYHCRLVQAVAHDIAVTSAEIEADWVENYAQVMLTAGADDNPVYFSHDEARQELFKALAAGLEFTSDGRLGRPLGTYDKPRPNRADAWRSGRSLRHVQIALRSMKELGVILTEDMSDELAEALSGAFDRAQELADRMDDPIFAGVAEPQTRIRVEALQFSVDSILSIATERLGPELGVSGGFNSLDGD
jgi:uncharacterized protein